MKLIPTGIENFKELIDKDYYYVDKTNLIVNIINEKVVLYTDLEDLVRHLICPCFIISFPLKKRKILIYLIIKYFKKHRCFKTSK